MERTVPIDELAKYAIDTVRRSVEADSTRGWRSGDWRRCFMEWNALSVQRTWAYPELLTGKLEEFAEKRRIS